MGKPTSGSIVISYTVSDPSRSDFLLPYLKSLPLKPHSETKVLEIGCGHGTRLLTLSNSFEWTVTGIDPSQNAVERLTKEGINCLRATADNLPFDDHSFDLVIFGFCLYVCDSNDLFRIAAEAHRVLKQSSWVAILDFWNPDVTLNPYSHAEGIFSRKQDYPSMFSWHPEYTIFDHSLRHHSDFRYTDSRDDWVSVSIIRKKPLP